MPNWLLNTAIGFFLSFTAFMLAAFFVGERKRAQQGIVSDLQASKAVRRIAAALFTALLATTVAMAAFISLWFLLVPIPCLLLMLPTFSPASRWKSAPAVVEGPVIQRAMWDMSIIGAWMLETQGFEYATWFQSMLSDPTINAALREYASGMEDRFVTRVYNWSRAILVGAYLLKLGEKDFSSWRTRLLATLDQTTQEEIVPLIMELRHAAIELQADVGKGRRGDQILSILKNEPATELFIGRVVGNYRILEMLGGYSIARSSASELSSCSSSLRRQTRHRRRNSRSLDSG